MDGPRKRLVPFMKRMIGRCPGVTWFDQDRGMFRISWRHYNNKDWTEADSKIFLEWAKFTGKFKPGDEPDFPSWKTQLRCALNKIPDIEQVRHLHKNDGPNPYRVYRFVSASEQVNSSPNMSESSPSGSVQTDDSGVISPPMDQLDRILELDMEHHRIDCAQVDSAHCLPTVVKEEEEKHRQMQSPVYQITAIESPPQCVPTLASTQHFQQDCLTGEVYIAYYNNTSPGPSKQVNGAASSPLNEFSPTETILGAHPQEQSSSMEMVENMEERNNIPSDLRSVDSANLFLENVSMPSNITSVPSSFGSNTVNSLGNVESGRCQTGEASKSRVDETGLEVRPELQALSPPVQIQASSPLNQMPIITFRVLYGFEKHEVLSGQFRVNDCRFYFSRLGRQFWNNTLLDRPDALGPSDAQQISLPSTMSFETIDEIQRSKIMQLLDNMERGLVITVDRDGNIHANRLCKTRVFVTNGRSFSKSLDRQVGPVEIFNVQEQLKNRVATLNITFGQEIKIDHREPMKRILMVLEITHESLKAYMDQLPSLPSLNDPLISNDDNHDKLIEGFKSMQF